MRPIPGARSVIIPPVLCDHFSARDLVELTKISTRARPINLYRDAPAGVEKQFIGAVE